MVTTGEYRFVIADKAGVVQAEVPALNPVWSYVLNDSGTASFTLPIRHETCTRALMAAGQRELHIYKGATRVWGGHLWSAEGSLDDEQMRFAFEGWFGHLKRRLVTTTQKFVADDQLDIAWDLINYTQSKTSGGLGITRASATPSGVTRDRTYPFWEMVNIGEELISLTELDNSFDFEITPNKAWTTFRPSKGVVRPVHFEEGKNIGGLSILDDAGEMATSFYAIGAGDGKNTCVANAVDATAATNFGLQEMAESWTDVKHFATLQARADMGLRVRKKVRVEPQLSAHYLDEDPYTNVVGDRVTIIADHGYLTINAQYRIISVTIQLTNDGREAVTLAFDTEYDV